MKCRVPESIDVLNDLISHHCVALNAADCENATNLYHSYSLKDIAVIPRLLYPAWVAGLFSVSLLIYGRKIRNVFPLNSPIFEVPAGSWP